MKTDYYSSDHDVWARRLGSRRVQWYQTQNKIDWIIYRWAKLGLSECCPPICPNKPVNTARLQLIYRILLPLLNAFCKTERVLMKCVYSYRKMNEYSLYIPYAYIWSASICCENPFSGGANTDDDDVIGDSSILTS